MKITLFVGLLFLAVVVRGSTFSLYTMDATTHLPRAQFDRGEPFVIALDYATGYDGSRISGNLSKGNGEIFSIGISDFTVSYRITTSYSQPGAYLVSFAGLGEALGYFDPQNPTIPTWGAAEQLSASQMINVVPEPGTGLILMIGMALALLWKPRLFWASLAAGRARFEIRRTQT